MKYLLFLLPSFALANEAQLGCNLERSKAEVQASIAAAPVAYGSANDNTEDTVTLGIAQSFSGRSRAALIREAAEVRCDAIRATVAIEEHLRFSLASIQRDGALAELNFVEKAIALSKSNIALLDAQLAARTITIAEHTAARQVLVNAELREADLLRTLSKVVLPVQVEGLSSKIEAARLFESRAAGLTAKAQAESGWDVRPSVGVRQELTSNGKTSAFVGLSFSYSFGYSGARDAARAVEDGTASYLAAQGSGFTQVLLRQAKEIDSMISAETLAASTAARQLTHLRSVQSSVSGIETALAQNTSRSLELQVLILEAERVGAETRLSKLQELRSNLNS